MQLIYSLKTNEQSAKLVFPSEHSLDGGNAFIKDFLVEEPLAPRFVDNLLR